MTRAITITQPNPVRSAAGRKGGTATAEKYGQGYYKRLGSMPCAPGKKRGRPGYIKEVTDSQGY